MGPALKPGAQSNIVEIAKNQVLVLPPGAYFSDPNGDAVRFSAASPLPAANGRLVIDESTGEAVFLPRRGSSGVTTFSLRASDSNGLASDDSAAFTVTVREPHARGRGRGCLRSRDAPSQTPPTRGMCMPPLRGRARARPWGQVLCSSPPRCRPPPRTVSAKPKLAAPVVNSASVSVFDCSSAGVSALLKVTTPAATTVVSSSAYDTTSAFAPRGFSLQAALPSNDHFQGDAVCKFARAAGPPGAAAVDLTSIAAWYSCLQGTLKFKCGGRVLLRAAAQASGDFAASDFSAPLEFAPACAPGTAVGLNCLQP